MTVPPAPAETAPVRTALISVSDKTGVVALAEALAARGVRLISTGGTAVALRMAGLSVADVAEVTGSPEILDGRVKTLHPRVHGGLLGRRDRPEDLAAMAEHGIGAIDLLVVNLYPFEATVAAGHGLADCVENIDIGGPAMIRAAAKNHAHVTVIVDPEDYGPLLEEMDAQEGAVSASFRQRCALTAFARTAAYDAAVSNWLAGVLEAPAPRRRAMAGRLVSALRYGENPHQAAAFYADGSGGGLAAADLVQGKALSYNNINDADAALALVAEFASDADPACVIVKHANPCGAAFGASLEEAYRRAFDCDRTSAFGGIVAVSRPLDAAAARAITEIFTEVVVAPGADEAARAVFAAKPNLRLLLLPDLPDPSAPGLVMRQVAGGFLVQDRDAAMIGPQDLQVVTAKAPSPEQIDDLLFAWRVAKHVKSNAIVYARERGTVGIGAGQMSRVDSTRIAGRKAFDMGKALELVSSPAEGAVVASDAFFPFPDGLLAAAEHGAVAVIQPGGSVRDAEVIAAADAAGLAMVFTGHRHFRH